MNTSDSKILNTLQVVFQEVKLFPRQIPVFRGAVAEWAGWDKALFHNHQPGEKLHYRYPLIQYRCMEGHGCLYALEEGVAAVQQALFRSGDHTVESKEGPMGFNYYSIANEQHELKLSDKLTTYYLNDWLALNSENYRIWKEHPGLGNRVSLLEGALAGHLLAFATGIGWQLPQGSLKVELLDIYNKRKVKVHGNESIAFNVRYRTNLQLPDDIALGKAVSHGFGVQNRMRERSEGGRNIELSQLLQEVGR